MAYAKAYYTVTDSACSKSFVWRQVDPVLSDFYKSRLQMSLYYNSPEIIPRVITLQTSIRNYIAKSRMTKIVSLLRTDPENMHQKVMAGIRDLKMEKNSGPAAPAAPLPRHELNLALLRQMAHFCTLTSDADQMGAFYSAMDIIRKDLAIAQAKLPKVTDSHVVTNVTNLQDRMESPRKKLDPIPVPVLPPLPATQAADDIHTITLPKSSRPTVLESNSISNPVED